KPCCLRWYGPSNSCVDLKRSCRPSPATGLTFSISFAVASLVIGLNARDGEILFQHVHRIDAHDEGGDGLAQREGACFLGGANLLDDEAPLVAVAAAEALHADAADAL